MKQIFFLIASIVAVQAALQEPAADPTTDAPAQPVITATAVPSSMASLASERQSHISAFMATQTDAALASAYASAQAARTSVKAFMQTASPSQKAKAKEGFSHKMKHFFKNMQVKAQKRKEASSTVAVETTSTAAAAQ